MIRNYRDLTRWEMEQIDKEETIVLIPLGALEQHGSQAPLGTDDIIAEAMTKEIQKALEGEGEDDFPMLVFPVIPGGAQYGTQKFLRFHYGETGHLLSYALRHQYQPCPSWL